MAAIRTTLPVSVLTGASDRVDGCDPGLPMLPSTVDMLANLGDALPRHVKDTDASFLAWNAYFEGRHKRDSSEAEFAQTAIEQWGKDETELGTTRCGAACAAAIIVGETYARRHLTCAHHLDSCNAWFAADRTPSPSHSPAQNRSPSPVGFAADRTQSPSHSPAQTRSHSPVPEIKFQESSQRFRDTLSVTPDPDDEYGLGMFPPGTSPGQGGARNQTGDDRVASTEIIIEIAEMTESSPAKSSPATDKNDMEAGNGDSAALDNRAGLTMFERVDQLRRIGSKYFELPKATLDHLLTDENVEVVTQVLTHGFKPTTYSTLACKASGFVKVGVYLLRMECRRRTGARSRAYGVEQCLEFLANNHSKMDQIVPEKPQRAAPKTPAASTQTQRNYLPQVDGYRLVNAVISLPDAYRERFAGRDRASLDQTASERRDEDFWTKVAKTCRSTEPNNDVDKLVFEHTHGSDEESQDNKSDYERFQTEIEKKVAGPQKDVFGAGKSDADLGKVYKKKFRDITTGIRDVLSRWKSSGNGDDVTDQEDVNEDHVIEIGANGLKTLNPLFVRSSNILDHFISAGVQRYAYTALVSAGMLHSSISMLSTEMQHGSGMGSNTAGSKPPNSKGVDGKSKAGMSREIVEAQVTSANQMQAILKTLVPVQSTETEKSLINRKRAADADFAERQVKHAKDTAISNHAADLQAQVEKLHTCTIPVLQKLIVKQALWCCQRMYEDSGRTPKEVETLVQEFAEELDTM